MGVHVISHELQPTSLAEGTGYPMDDLTRFCHNLALKDLIRSHPFLDRAWVALVFLAHYWQMG